MTHRHEAVRDVNGDRDVAARWCALAEQRLQHLSEMFETGRWRRYHSELAFLENIQEAKRAVQTWRALATGADVAEAAASVTPAFGWSPATMPRVFPREPQAPNMEPKAVQVALEAPVSVKPDPKPDVRAEITEAPIAPLAASDLVMPSELPKVEAPLTARAVRAAHAGAAEVASLAASVLMAPFAAAAVKAPRAVPVAKAPKTAATVLPQFAPPTAEIVAAPERLVEFTFSLDGLEAKYPLLRNAF